MSQLAIQSVTLGLRQKEQGHPRETIWPGRYAKSRPKDTSFVEEL